MADENTGTADDDTSNQDPPPAADADHQDDDNAPPEDWKRRQDALHADLRKERDKVARLEAEAEEARKAGLDDHARELEEAKAAGRAEADAEWAQRLVASEAKRLAATMVADSAIDDIPRELELAEFLAPDGTVKADDLRAEIDRLVTDKPHLARPQSATPPPADPDLGNKGEGTRGAQVSQAELDQMTPAEAHQARLDGRLDSLLGS